MSTVHENRVAHVLMPEWKQRGHWLRLVRTIDDRTECQIRRNGHWWPVEQVID